MDSKRFRDFSAQSLHRFESLGNSWRFTEHSPSLHYFPTATASDEGSISGWRLNHRARSLRSV